MKASDERKIQFTWLQFKDNQLQKHPISCYVSANTTLLDVLRNHLHFTGAKESCGVGECGSCTIILNGEAVRSCLILAFEADGAEIMTVESLADGDNLHPLQKSFIKHDAIQCGYCTAGFLMAAYRLYKEHKNPTVDQIKEAMSGHLCRCTGYQTIYHAIENANQECIETNFL